MGGETLSRKAGCKLVFPEVAQLLKFLVEYGKCQEKKKTCVKCYIDPASKVIAYTKTYIFSAFEQGLEFPPEQSAFRLLSHQRVVLSAPGHP